MVFYRNFKSLKNNDFNLAIEIPKPKEFKIDAILEILRENIDNFDLIKYENRDEQLLIMLKLNIVNFESLDLTRKYSRNIP